MQYKNGIQEQRMVRGKNWNKTRHSIVTQFNFWNTWKLCKKGEGRD